MSGLPNAPQRFEGPCYSTSIWKDVASSTAKARFSEFSEPPRIARIERHVVIASEGGRV